MRNSVCSSPSSSAQYTRATEHLKLRCNRPPGEVSGALRIRMNFRSGKNVRPNRGAYHF